MTNDYLFRALMQTNTNVLKSLICALLHLDSDDVTSITILNPIELGKTLDEKNYILDIKVELNGRTTINLELQVINVRRTSCCSQQRLLRREVLSLTSKNAKMRFSFKGTGRNAPCATWTAVFKATTWEELKMLAKNNQYIKDAVATVCQLTQEEKIRQQCEAREDYYRRTAGREKRLKQTTKERDELKEQLSQKEAEIAKKDTDIAKKDAEIEHLRSLLANRDNSEK